MSRAWDEMMERLGDVERKVGGLMTAPAKRPEWRREWVELRRAIERTANFRTTIRYESILASEPVWHRTTFTFDSSYNTGGEDLVIESLVPTFLDAVIPPKNGYTFKYDTAKILAYEGPATEVAATTDMLTNVGTVQVLVMGTRPASLPGYSSSGGETLIGASLRVTEGVSADSTNYWTLEVAIKRSGQTFGETIARRDTSVAGISDNKAVVLFPATRTFDLGRGDVVLLKATSKNSSTAGIGEAFLELDLQRKVL